MKFSLSVLTVLLVLTMTGSAFAQQGVTTPLMSDLEGVYFGDTFQQGTVRFDKYRFLIEPIAADIPSQQISVFMWSDAPNNQFQNFALRFPKEEIHYTAAGWSGASPGTYTVNAFVAWPSGVGVVTGNHYSAGGTILTLVVTITP